MEESIVLSGNGKASFLFSDVVAEVRSDLWFYIGIAAYVLAAYALAIALDAESLVRPFLYVEGWVTRSAIIVLMALGVCLFVFGVVRHPRAPVAGIRQATRGMVCGRFFAGCLMLVVLPVFYGTFTSIKNMLPLMAPFAWDPWFADLDRALHGGVEPGLALRHALGLEVTLALDVAYSMLWFGLLMGVGAWAALSAELAHLRSRFFLTLVLAWIVIGNLLAGLFLSAGPCFYGEVTGDNGRFAELVGSMVGQSARYREYLWELHAGGGIDLGTGISAFPSMHLAIATLLMLYLWSVSRPLGILGAVFLTIMQVGSVVLGWHYAIDGYASIAIAIALWRIAGLVFPAQRTARASGSRRFSSVDIEAPDSPASPLMPVGIAGRGAG